MMDAFDGQLTRYHLHLDIKAELALRFPFSIVNECPAGKDEAEMLDVHDP